MFCVRLLTMRVSRVIRKSLDNVDSHRQNNINGECELAVRSDQSTATNGWDRAEDVNEQAEERQTTEEIPSPPHIGTCQSETTVRTAEILRMICVVECL